MRISDWSSDVCSSDLPEGAPRRLGVPREAGAPIASYTTDAEIKAHPDYRAAKAGDQEAAARLVPDVVAADTVEAARERFGPDTIYVPVIAEEATGQNKITDLTANYYAAATGATVEDRTIHAARQRGV